MISIVVKAVLGVVLNFLRGWLSDKRAAEAEHEAGRAEANADTNRKTAEVTDAMAQAGQRRPADSDVTDSLSTGKF